MPLSPAYLTAHWIGCDRRWTPSLGWCFRQGSNVHDITKSLLYDLHSSRVPQRIEFKLALLVYRSLHGLRPHYVIADEFHRVANLDSRRCLRSASTLTLVNDHSACTSHNDRRPRVSGCQSGTAYRQDFYLSRDLKSSLFIRSFLTA